MSGFGIRKQTGWSYEEVLERLPDLLKAKRDAEPE